MAHGELVPTLKTTQVVEYEILSTIQTFEQSTRRNSFMDGK